MVKVAPSILSADFSRLGSDIKKVEKYVDMFHIDVMDGRFVPNITIGMPVVKALRQHTKKPFDVHLMIERPGRYVSEFADAGADSITFHVEAVQNPKLVVNKIKKSGAKAAVAINPDTSWTKVKPVIKSASMILVMSVYPGFGGQKFISSVLPKVTAIRKLIDNRGLATEIEIDGGINAETAKPAVEAGVDILVAGSYIYDSSNPIKRIESLKKITALSAASHLGS